MSLKTNLLWVDGIGGLAVGVLVLALASWLSSLHGLPKNLIVFLGVANLVYGSYSTSLAFRSRRPRKWVVFLVFANILWGVLCLSLFLKFNQTIAITGVLHLVGEGIYVGGLGYLEWRWKEFLIKA